MENATSLRILADKVHFEAEKLNAITQLARAAAIAVKSNTAQVTDYDWAAIAINDMALEHKLNAEQLTNSVTLFSANKQ